MVAPWWRVADIYEELGDRPLEGQATYNHGLALLKAQQIDDSIGAFRRSAAICREVGELQCEGMALGNLGHVLLAMGQTAQARTCWLHALEAFREAGLRAEATQAEQLLRQLV